MKRVIISIFVLFITLTSYAQVTLNPYVQSKNNPGVIEKIVLTDEETIVYIKMPRQSTWGGWVQISSATAMVPMDHFSELLSINDARQLRLEYPDFIPSAELSGLYSEAIRKIKDWRQALSDVGWLIRGLGPDQLDTKYKSNKSDTYFELHFDRLPIGVEKVFIRELIDGGFEWYGVKLNNPFPSVPNTGYNEARIKPIIDDQNDGIVGIYKEINQDDTQCKLACYMDGDTYRFIYLGGKDEFPHWKIGDTKAILEPTATPAVYSGYWYSWAKTKIADFYVTFEGNAMKVYLNGEETPYIKLYPTVSPAPIGGGGKFANKEEWSGTGFALLDNYIATNYHVIEDAKTIWIQGVGGDLEQKYKAKVLATDKFNDLAILQVQGVNISNTNIPYMVKTTTSDVGEDVFVLGYPLTSTMGEEIKLTTGVVSSKTGYQGDVSIYQISAPIQPGNSGGPLFDENGNVIGIVSAKHNDAENVGYAVKASYLRNLMESAISTNVLPQTNKVANNKLSDKVKILKDFVYYITCSSKE